VVIHDLKKTIFITVLEGYVHTVKSTYCAQIYHVLVEHESSIDAKYISWYLMLKHSKRLP